MPEKLYCVKCERETEHKIIIITRLRGAVYECLSCGQKKQMNVRKLNQEQIK